MSIQDFLDNCVDGVELSRSMYVNWSVSGVGFGQFRFYTGDDGKIHIDNETMNKDFIKRVLCMVVDEAILDDDQFKKPPEDIISDEGC